MLSLIDLETVRAEIRAELQTLAIAQAAVISKLREEIDDLRSVVRNAYIGNRVLIERAGIPDAEFDALVKIEMKKMAQRAADNRTKKEIENAHA